MPTLGDLRTLVGRTSGMDYLGSSTDQDLLNMWINSGVREVLLRTHCHVASATLTTTVDEWQYDLSLNAMALKEIWRPGEDSPMTRVQPAEILAWQRSASDSSNLYYAFMGANMLMLWPTPSSSYEIDLIYVPLPSEMTADDDDPSEATFGGVPTEYHEAIRLWALSHASDHEHEQGTQRGVAYLAQFDEYMRRVINPAVARKGGRLPRVRVGRGRPISSATDRYPF